MSTQDTGPIVEFAKDVQEFISSIPTILQIVLSGVILSPIYVFISDNFMDLFTSDELIVVKIVISIFTIYLFFFFVEGRRLSAEIVPLSKKIDSLVSRRESSHIRTDGSGRTSDIDSPTASDTPTSDQRTREYEPSNALLISGAVLGGAVGSIGGPVGVAIGGATGAAVGSAVETMMENRYEENMRDVW